MPFMNDNERKAVLPARRKKTNAAIFHYILCCAGMQALTPLNKCKNRDTLSLHAKNGGVFDYGKTQCVENI